MNLLLTTLSLLTLLTLFTFRESKIHFDQQTLIKVEKLVRQEEEKQALDMAKRHYSRLLRKAKGIEDKGGKGNPNKKKKSDRPPLRLDGNYERGKQDLIDLKKESSTYEVAARLLRNVYGEFSFFQVIPNAEYIVLDAIVHATHPEQFRALLPVNFRGPLQRPTHFTAVPFQDREQRALYCKLLLGGKEGKRRYPPLLDFVTFSGKKRNIKVNIHRVSKELLAAILNHQQAAQEIIDERDRRHERGAYSRRGKIYTEEYLTQEYVDGIYKKYGLTFPSDQFQFDVKNKQ